MKNVKIEVQGNQIVITIDASKTYGPSSSGKSEIVATTSGSVTIPGTDIKLGLNAYKASATKDF